jgi:hypothetical protein
VSKHLKNRMSKAIAVFLMHQLIPDGDLVSRHEPLSA